MHIANRYLEGEPIREEALRARPIRSEKIESIFRRVRKMVEA